MPEGNNQENLNNNGANGAGKKAVKTAAKTAVNYFTGGKGGAVVDKLANTKLGNKALNVAGKGLQKNPITRKGVNRLNNSGALDKADEASSMLGGKGNSNSASKGTIGSSSKNGNSSKTSMGSRIGSSLKNSIFGDNKTEDMSGGSAEGTDIGKAILNFLKKNPGVVASIVFLLFIILIPLLIVMVIASAVMYVVQILSNVSQVAQDVGQIIWNGITFSGWRTDQNVYLFNIEESSKYYLSNVDETTADEDKIRYYVNTTAFYSNVVNPDAIEEVGKEKDNETESEKPEEIKNNESDDVTTFIGSSEELKNKYGSVKGDPKALIENMFECGVYESGILNPELKCSSTDASGENEKWYFSDEKYEKYLIEEYVPEKFIDCNGCSDDEKKNMSKKITSEIMSQAKSFYTSHNANDQSNYTAYGISTSGIKVKDRDGKELGIYSLTEYVETVVERDISKYNSENNTNVSDEVRKAYALTVISTLLANISNGTIVEENFDPSIVTETTKKAVDAVKDLKIMKEGKVYYNTFDFEKAENVDPQEYEAILKALFGDDISIEKSISDGLQLDPTTGFYMRVEAPSTQPGTESYENYYGKNKIGLIGECAWYATNRAREITNILGVRTWTTNRHGGNFCLDDGDAKYYNRCWPEKGEKCSPKQGAIISWGYKWGPYVEYGHVAIIEKVEGNNVIYSDSATNRGSTGYGADTIPNNLRLTNCISNPNKSCITTDKKATIDELENGGSYGRFIHCYIYLDEPLE